MLIAVRGEGDWFLHASRGPGLSGKRVSRSFQISRPLHESPRTKADPAEEAAGREEEREEDDEASRDSGPRGRDGEEEADAASASITKPPGYDSLALLLSFASLLIPPDSAPLSSLTGAPWRATKNCGDPPAGPPPLPAR